MKVSGNINDLVRRLRREGNYSILDFLRGISKDQLKDICGDLDLKVEGTVQDHMHRILRELSQDWSLKDWENEENRVEKRKKKYRAEGKKELRDFFFSIYSETKQVERKKPKREIVERVLKQRIKRTGDFKKLISAIRRWVPNIRHSTEDGYRSEIHSYLQHKYGYPVRMEAGAIQADILVEGKFPIEIKKIQDSKHMIHALNNYEDILQLKETPSLLFVMREDVNSLKILQERFPIPLEGELPSFKNRSS